VRDTVVVDKGYVIGTGPHTGHAGCAEIRIYLRGRSYIHGVLGKDGQRPSGGPGRLHNGFFRELGTVSVSTQKHSIGSKIEWPELDVGLKQEALIVPGEFEHAGNLPGF
jgi:hypothetical protein